MYLFSITVFIFVRCTPRSGVARSYGSSVFYFFEKPPYCFAVSAPIYILAESIQGPLFPASSPTFAMCSLLDDNHSDRPEVIAHYGLNLHFSGD